VNGLPFIASAPVLIEISQDALRVLDRERSLESPLERLANGRLTDSCRQRLELELHGFLKPKAWQPRRRAVCAMGARGISLRRLALPVTSQEQQQRLLRLQIESEFPLPPEQLAWGTLPLNGQLRSPATDSTTQEVLVFAVRRELIEEYQTLFVACGLNPVFTLAALARARLCPPTKERWALLDVQRRDAELVVFDQGAPSAIQILPWGADNLLMSPNCANSLDRSQLGRRLCLSGDLKQNRAVSDALSQAVGADIAVESITLAYGNTRCAALRGLQTLLEQGHVLPQVVLQTDPKSTRATSTAGRLGKWAIAAGALALGCLLLRYVETSLKRSHLSKAIDQVRDYRQSLPLIDQQLGFLQYLQTNRQPYLRIMAAVAESASPGMQLESISLNRRGDLLLRGTVQGQQPSTEFRTKLVESGAFTSVVLEEQSPGQGQRKITFRIAARWDPESVRNLPDLPPVEKKPGLSGPPGRPMPNFSRPVIPMPPGGPPQELTLPPGSPPSAEMPVGPVIRPEGEPTLLQVEPKTP